MEVDFKVLQNGQMISDLRMDETGRFQVGPTHYCTKAKHKDVYIDDNPVTLTTVEYNRLVVRLYDQKHYKKEN